PPGRVPHRLLALGRASLGWLSRAMVCATVLVCGSIRDKVWSAGSSTHTCPPTATTRLGLVPAGIVAVTAPGAGSTRTTRPAVGSATHTAPDAPATLAAGALSGTVVRSAPLVAEISASRLPVSLTCAFA